MWKHHPKMLISFFRNLFHFQELGWSLFLLFFGGFVCLPALSLSWKDTPKSGNFFIQRFAGQRQKSLLIFSQTSQTIFNLLDICTFPDPSIRFCFKNAELFLAEWFLGKFCSIEYAYDTIFWTLYLAGHLADFFFFLMPVRFKVAPFYPR